MFDLFAGFLTEPDHDRDDEKDVVLRQSTVSSMDLCPARVGYALHDGFNDSPSEAMSFGSLVHQLIEDALRIDEVKPLSARYVLDRWRDISTVEGVDLDALADKDTLRASALEAVGAFSMWSDWYLAQPAFDFVGVEDTLWRPLGQLPNGRAVWLHGTPDAATMAMGYDWKTAGRGWGDGKLTFAPQPSAYTWLLEPLRGSLEYDWTYLIYDRRAAAWDVQYTHRGPAEVVSWVRHAWMRAKQIDAGAFPFTPTQTVYGKTVRGWWCSAKYCGAWDVCQGKYLADGTDETALTVSEWGG